MLRVSSARRHVWVNRDRWRPWSFGNPNLSFGATFDPLRALSAFDACVR
jgi:hypothetical protein